MLFFSITWASSGFTASDTYSINDLSGLSSYKDSDSVVVLKYPMKDESHGIPSLNDYDGGLYLNSPSNIKTDIEYDPNSNHYEVKQKMGNINYRPDNYMTQDEYIEYQFKKSVKDYWKQRSNAETMSQQGTKANKNLIPPIKINSEIFDRIFGSNVVDIRPQGSAELIFGVNSSYSQNPSIPVRSQRITSFNFDEKIQLSLIGKIGDRLKITTNYNTQATFDFEQRMKLEFVGGEDDIIKKIEAGNVNLPLNSTLISGSQTLFGIKTQLQFGKATVTTVVSQEKGQKKEINIENGAQTSTFEINADNYELNKHFFLSQYFKDNYDIALKNLPVINSAINVTKVEVWITNTSSNINETRNIVALTDLGENKSNYISNPTVVHPGSMLLPGNPANDLNPVSFTLANPSVRNKDQVSNTLINLGFVAVQDFEKVLSARKLSASEFSFNPRLGFISLTTNVNPDQVIGVAYQYTYEGVTYQVGELSTDGIVDPQCLMVKLLKSQNVSTKRDTLLWDLMMKNVYSINAYQIKPTDFKLEILYNNPSTGVNIPVIPESNLSGITGKPLIQIMNLDRINTAGDAKSDGVFDFIDGVTINASNGRIYFPVRKPFGEHLRNKINPTNSPPLYYLEAKYAYDQLYDSTKFIAQQFPDKNRFKVKGSYKSESGSEISLNALNIPENSVSVTAGGVPLTENVDYTVDYNIGKVKIINDGILRSGTPIKVAFESNLFLGFQQKSLYGAHVDYRVSKDFNLGATAIHLSERPLIQKVSIGDEPIKNTVVGMNGNYSSETPFLTRMVDKLPLYSSKEMSSINASGEVAALIPGHSRMVGKEGNAYIDDFEGSQSPIDIRNFASWYLASTPQGNNPLWPEGNKTDSSYGFNRARLAWYTIDNKTFQDKDTKLPYYTSAMKSDNYQRAIVETELFPKKQSPTGIPVPIQTLDLAYYPSERGQYNYDAIGSTISAGTDPATGKLKSPKSRWGGIMRKIETNDFEAANIEYVQMWVMDPFNSDLGSQYNNLQSTSGELIVQLGNVSEDALRDGKNSFENGLPTSPTDQTHPTQNTAWGRVPQVQAIVNAFDNDPNTRSEQDVGLDGLKDADEKNYFAPFLSAMNSLGTAAYNSVQADPSSDFYHHFTGDDYDNNKIGTLERYKYFNGLENNSPINTGSQLTSSTTLPNTEDINRDNNLSENEGYYQYRIKISPSDLSPNNVGFNYINDVVTGGGTTIDQTSVDAKWYQLKIPVREFEAKYGQIEDFRSIRFVRLLLRGFDKPVILRIAKMDLIRGEWRKYNYNITDDGDYLGNDDPGTSFDVSAVNFEENGTKKPVNYVLPPKIEQQLSYGTSNPVRMNEQSISLKVCNLENGNARATYKNVSFDVRSYKKLRMYVHAEAQANGTPLYDDDLTCFVRLGTDYTQNYYEYEISLKVTPSGYYDGNSEDARYQIWKKENEMELVFSDLQEAKQKRNAEIYSNSNNTSLTKRFLYTITDPQGNPRKVYVKGNPNLSDVKTIMIGIRNPKKVGVGVDDDGLPKCAEVWVNELRLADFDESGGWASTARVTAKLADLGTVSFAGNYSTPGWGSIDKKVSERQRETKYQYDISSQIALNRFLPAEWRISLPMYIGYSQAIIRPQYNPLDPDIFLNDVINNLPNDSLRNDLKYRTIDETTRNSVNFTNVKKEKSPDSKRNNIYDIENFAFNYSYSKFHNHGAMIEYNNMRDYRTGMVYSYSTNPKAIQPFGKINFLNKKAFALIRDFNFNPYPSKYSFLLDIDRHYAEKLNRNTTGLEIPMDTFYDKRFTMLRSYDLKYDITRSLKVDFHADNNSRVLEPYGAIDTEADKEYLKKSLFKGGNNTMYTQRTKVDYAIPINKFPMLEWVSANASYTTDYKWTRAPYSVDSLGSFIQNGNQKTLNMQGNLTTLYNKVPFLKKVNQGIKKKKEEKKEGIKQPSKTPKDSTKKKEKEPVLFPQYFARTLMMLKNVSLNITDNEGSSLAGYGDSTHFFGMNDKNKWSPGPAFVFGKQDNFGKDSLHFTDYAAQKGWIVKNKLLNVPFTKNKTTNITARANLEPLPGFKIELTANKNQSINNSEFFRWAYDSTLGAETYMHQSPIESGNFSMSFITWHTAFEKIHTDYFSAAFQNMLNYRETISNKLAEKYDHSKGLPGNFAPGYGNTSQNVLLYSFLSAYSGKDPNNYSLDLSPTTPLPNWRITYDGLGKIKQLKKIFKTITLSHAYRSSYSFSYTNNLNSNLKQSGKPVNQDINDNYIFYEQLNSVTIAEQLSPLIKVDVSLQNSVQINAEIKKERNLSLSFANNQLTEVRSNELVIGSGYKWKDVPLKNPFSKSKKTSKKTIKSDINIRADFSVRQNLTLIRKVVEQVTQPTSGQIVYALKTSADYQISQRITARLFYDWNFNNPRISTSFKSKNTNAGVSIRFSLI